MNYLTIDTSTTIVVGVCHSDMGEYTELALATSDSTREHSEKLTPLISRALAEAHVHQPDAIVVGTGPGAFTGLRAGLVTARTLARAWNVPVYGLSSLEVLGLAAADRGAQEVAPLIDARRREVYAMRLRPMGGDDVAVIAAPSVMKPDELARILTREPAILASSSADLYPELDDVRDVERQVVELSPVAMVRLVESRLSRLDAGEELSLETEPLYLRRPDTHGGSPQPAS